LFVGSIFRTRRKVHRCSSPSSKFRHVAAVFSLAQDAPCPGPAGHPTGSADRSPGTCSRPSRRSSLAHHPRFRSLIGGPAFGSSALAAALVIGGFTEQIDHGNRGRSERCCGGSLAWALTARPRSCSQRCGGSAR
jgi:hypothetical protein